MTKTKHIQQLDKVFTYAVGPAGNTELIFSSLNPNDNVLTPETFKLIQDAELVHKIVGYPNIIYSNDHTSPHPMIRVTSETDRYLALQLPGAKKGDGIYINSSPTTPEHLDLSQVYDACSLPHKYALGCQECIGLNASDVPKMCRVRELLVTPRKYGYTVHGDQLKNSLEHLKTTIGPFTFISPGHTRTEYFTKKDRPINQHSFANVHENLEAAAKGGKEAHRVIKYKKTECTRCLVQPTCWTEVKWCSSPYLKSAKEYSADAIANVQIPFTRKQIKYLLINSGPLNSRYNRRLYALTFYVTPYHTLQFGLRRTTSNYFDFKPFKTFKDAEQVIKAHGSDLRWSDSYHGKMTNLQLGVLLATARKTASPTSQNGWRATSYPAYYLDGHPNVGYTLYYARGREGLLPWSTVVQSWEDLYLNWGRFDGAIARH